jgi:hypothetical protein
MSIARSIDKNLSSLLGWRTNKKYVIIESDDWGSIRMPSRAAYERLHIKGLPLTNGDSLRYNLYDGLAGPDDFDGLFKSLLSFKDFKDQHPVITSVSIVANPAFDKIRESGFQQYFYEPFTQTLERFGLSNSISFWKEGVKLNLFKPQFHGREHLNVAAWMRALQRKDKFTHLAFDEGMWGFRHAGSSSVNFQAAFDLEIIEDIQMQKDILITGLDLFEDIHGYRPSFFVPPNGPFNHQLEKTIYQSGIKYLSTPKLHNEPLGEGKTRLRIFYLGKKSNNQILFITRNCLFEPSKPGKDWVASCIADMKIAFRWGKPAIISSHRVNYIGIHDETNRKNGLANLNRLFTKMLELWPDIEFITTDKLGEIILKDIK